MESLSVTVVRDGKYIGLTDGKKVLMIRDAFGKTNPVYEHLIGIFGGYATGATLLQPDFELIKKGLEESNETTITAKPLELPAD
jgi:hypothetical protein